MTEKDLGEFCKKIGSELKRMRRRQGLSQQQASEKIGVTRMTIYRIENGDMGVALGTVVALSQLYKAPPNFVLTQSIGENDAMEIC